MNVDEANEVARKERLTLIRDRSRVFKEVFGTWDKQSAHGKIIIEALTVKFGHALPPNVLDSIGQTDPYQTWRRLGHFDVLEFIRTQLEWQEKDNVSSSSGSNP